MRFVCRDAVAVHETGLVIRELCVFFGSAHTTHRSHHSPRTKLHRPLLPITITHTQRTNREYLAP